MACSVSTQSNALKLNGTKWSYYFGRDNLSSYFLFIDGKKYKFYNAETGDTTFGSYFLRNDTILLNQEYSVFDDEFPKDSRHRAPKLQFKMLVNRKSQLGFIEQWDNNTRKWVDNYFFKKE